MQVQSMDGRHVSSDDLGGYAVGVAMEFVHSHSLSFLSKVVASQTLDLP